MNNFRDNKGMAKKYKYLYNSIVDAKKKGVRYDVVSCELLPGICIHCFIISMVYERQNSRTLRPVSDGEKFAAPPSALKNPPDV